MLKRSVAAAAVALGIVVGGAGAAFADQGADDPAGMHQEHKNGEGRHHHRGEDRRHHQRGDDHGRHHEAGDDHGGRHHHEPGDDHGGHGNDDWPNHS